MVWGCELWLWRKTFAEAAYLLPKFEQQELEKRRDLFVDGSKNDRDRTGGGPGLAT